MIACVAHVVCVFRELWQLINGKWVPAVSGKVFDTINPATGGKLTAVAHGDKADCEVCQHTRV